MQAGLKNLLSGGLGCLGNGSRVFDRVRQRRFAIDVFARLQRRQHDLLVLVRGRGHDHRLDLLVVEDALTFLGLRGLGHFPGATA